MKKINESYRFLVLLLTLCLLISCGKDDSELTADAIESANIDLTNDDCEAAITTLEAITGQQNNAEYIQVKASAYACRSGFSEIGFFGNDISKIGTTASGFLGSLTKFSTSEMTSASDSDYKFTNLQTAIDTILYSGNISAPSSANRSTVFSETEVGNMNVQLLYMLVAQLGKYFFYYGNADPENGTKGTGAVANGNNNGNSNTCLANYPDATAAGLVTVASGTGAMGSCTDATSGHPDLQTMNATTATRMCHGVVLFNNIVDTLSNTTLSSVAGGLSSVSSVIETAFDSACTAAVGNSVCTVKSQSDCVTQFGPDGESDMSSLQIYFAAVFETLFQ